MAKTNTVVMRTDLSAEECLRRLGEATDVGKRTIFSFTGYRGSKPVLATLDGNRFTLWKRLYYRNDLRPRFFGTLVPQDRGTRIEGYFAADRRMKFVFLLWVGIVVFVNSSVLIPLASHPRGDGDWMGTGSTAVVILIAALAAVFGRWLARGQETFLKEFVETTLEAEPEAGGVTISQRFIENKPL